MEEQAKTVSGQDLAQQAAEYEKKTGKKATLPNGAFAWVVLILCLLAGICVIGNSNKINMSMALLLAEFNQGAAWGGTLTSTIQIVTAIVVIPLGALTSRFDVRKIIVISLLCCFVGALGGSFAHSTVALFGFRVFEALAYAGTYCTGAILICKWFTSEKRAIPMGLWNAVVGMAGFVIGQASRIIIPVYGWRGVWTYEAIFAIVIAVIFFLIVKERPSVGYVEEDKKEGAEKAKISDALKVPVFWIACIINGFSGLGIKGVLSFSSLIFTESAGVSAATASNLFSFLSIGMIFAPIIGGVIYRIVGRRRGPVLVVLFCVSMVVELLMFIAVRDQTTAWIFTALCGFLGMTFMPGVYTMVADHSPSPAMTGVGMNIMMFGQFVSGVVGSIVLGWFRDMFGTWDSIKWLIIILLVVGFFACIYMMIKDKQYWKDKDAAAEAQKDAA